MGQANPRAWLTFCTVRAASFRVRSLRAAVGGAAGGSFRLLLVVPQDGPLVCSWWCRRRVLAAALGGAAGRSLVLLLVVRGGGPSGLPLVVPRGVVLGCPWGWLRCGRP